MDRKRLDRIKTGMKTAEEYLHAAEILQGKGLFNPAVSLAHNSAFHAVSAAFLTAGIHGTKNFSDFIEALARFDHKLGLTIKKLNDDFDGFRIHPTAECDGKEAFLSIHRTKELLREVEEFLKRALR